MEINSSANGVLIFVGNEIFGNEITNETKNLITEEFLKDLFKLSKQHDLAHLVGNALDKNGLLPDNSDAKSRFLKERNMAIFRYEQIQYEIDQICDVLEQAKIQFIPLKGSVMRQYYPEPWMRTSCDIDVLVHEEDLQKAIDFLKSELNYRYESTGNHDAHLFSESGVHLELHYKLEPNDEQWNVVLEKIWDNLVEKNAGRCVLTQEMFYFYHVAHMVVHFKVGGCGVRPFLDLYLLKKHTTYNKTKLDEMLEQGGLIAFNNAVCALSDYWFADGEESPIVLELNDFILNAGMYGDMKNRVSIEKAKKKSKFKILWSRIFLPYSQLKYQYPTLQKCSILYPFYTIKRWFKLLKKENRKRATKELRETTQGDKEKQARIAKLLKELEI